jgi:PST family polysaccharide transporter
MRNALRATAALSVSSLVGILTGLVSAKGRAVLLGPEGVGITTLMQTLFTLPLLLASLGVGVALVRMVARASSDADDAAVAAIRRSAWLVRAGISGTAIVVIVLLRGSISRLLFGDARYATAVAIVGLALGFSLASDLQTSSLNAYRRISALAKVAILSALIGTASSLGIIWVWRTGGIAPAILANAAIGWIVATYFVRRQIPD